MKVKVGDIITFKSTGYKPNGEWSNRKFLQSAIVTNVRENSVSARRPGDGPLGERPWDYIHKDEIIDVFSGREK